MNQTRVPSPQLRESLFSHSLGQKGLWATSCRGLLAPSDGLIGARCRAQSPACSSPHAQYGLVPLQTVHDLVPGSTQNRRPGRPQHQATYGSVERGEGHCGCPPRTVLETSSSLPSSLSHSTTTATTKAGRRPGPQPRLSCLPPKQDLSSMNMLTYRSAHPPVI